MQIATRIKLARLEHLLSLEELAVKTGLSESLLASFENGREIPSLEMFDSLARAMGVPVKSLFYSDLDATLTPWLTPRPTLLQLVHARPRSASDVLASLFNPRRITAATHKLLSSVTHCDCGLKGKTHLPTLPPSNPQAPPADNSREDKEGPDPKA
jgi:transcriptional regulator with XRE-family HTH domain